jgi:hypothetical protein
VKKRYNSLMKLGTARRFSLACYFILSFCLTADATSIVAMLEKQRIILAADTRADRLGPVSEPAQRAFHDDFCKIAPLGPMAVAVSGAQDYKRNIAADPIPDWDALTDARAASTAYGDDLAETARDWARRGESHYELFNKVAPQRVMRLASTNSERVIVMAFFVGWYYGAPVLFWEKIYLDGDVISTIRTREQVLSARALPYTTLATTQELIEGNSPRTSAIAASWAIARPKIPDTEADWRWVEFLIKSTNKYDQSVGQTVNVLEVVAGRQAEWLQNVTCP